MVKHITQGSLPRHGIKGRDGKTAVHAAQKQLKCRLSVGCQHPDPVTRLRTQGLKVCVQLYAGLL